MKIKYGDLEKDIEKGLKQTRQYMDAGGAEEGHLVIFDRSVYKSWEEKIFRREEVVAGKAIAVWGM